LRLIKMQKSGKPDFWCDPDQDGTALLSGMAGTARP
jgi:hypothetical protein